MKISASIYSNKNRPIKELVSELDSLGVDLLHIDSIDDLSVFEDIAEIRQITDIPIDLHAITSTPQRYYDGILKHKLEYTTFQLENLTSKLQMPAEYTGRLGIAVVSDTSLDALLPYQDEMDFVLIMTTEPGKSGGKFNEKNFSKIRQFARRFPEKKIHVDGGVNKEVSFILRNMGVYSAVSGSYLVNADSMGAAIMHMTTRESDLDYTVSSFMLSKDHIPVLQEGKFSFRHILESIEFFRLGFTSVIDGSGRLLGIISSADVRRGLLAHIDDLNNVDIADMINTSPLVTYAHHTVAEMLQVIRSVSFPVLYLPVIDHDKKLVGVVAFNKLNKGE